MGEKRRQACNEHGTCDGCKIELETLRDSYKTK